jgi:hypothetical protein
LLALAVSVFTTGAEAQESNQLFDTPRVAYGYAECVRELLDLDSDGDIDAIGCWWGNVNHSTAEVRIYNNVNGALHSAQYLSLPLSFPFISLPTAEEISSCVGDFDGDGDDDFALSIGVSIIIFQANGTSADPTPIFVENLSVQPTSATSGDFDGDGDIDLAFGGPVLILV